MTHEEALMRLGKMPSYHMIVLLLDYEIGHDTMIGREMLEKGLAMPSGKNIELIGAVRELLEAQRSIALL